MPKYEKERFTLTIHGDLSGAYQLHIEPAPYPEPGSYSHRTWYDVRLLCYSRLSYLARFWIEHGPAGPPTGGVNLVLNAVIDVGDFAPVSDSDLHNYPTVPLWSGSDTSFNLNGSFTLTVPVVKVLEPYEPSGVDSDGFINKPLVDEGGFVYDYEGGSYKDGIPAAAGWVYLMAEEGATMHLEAAVADYCTVSVDKVLPFDMVLLEGVWPILKQSNENWDASSSITWTVNGRPTGDSGSLVSGIVEVTAAPGSVSCSVEGYPDQQNIALADVAMWPTLEFDLTTKLRSLSAAYGSSQAIRVQTKRKLSGSDWNPWTQEVAAAPDATLSFNQKYYDGTLQARAINEALQAYETMRKLERLPVRLWVEDSGNDDARDFRILQQYFPWQALAVSQDQNKQIAASKTITDADASIPLTESNLEGYRYLKIDTNPNFDPKAMTAEIGAKQFAFTSTANGVSSTLTIDLLQPSNLPAGFQKDHRNTRFPLDGPATPISGLPDTTLGDEENGLLFGILDRPTAISFSTLGAGETMVCNNVRLARETDNEAGILQPFDHEDILRGWTSETDNTYLTPALWLYSDHKLVGPWPYRAHVVPTTADPPYWSYWSLDSLKTFVDYIPGWHATVQTALSSPHLLGDSATKLMSGSLGAGHLVDYVWTGSAWADQTSQALPFTFRAALLLDEVDCWCWGDFQEPFDDLNTTLPIKASKVLRGQAEGIAPAGETIILKRDSNGANRGSAVAVADGWYRTGTPYGLGGIQHRTELQQGGNPFEGPWKVQNRYRGRTSFLEALTAGGHMLASRGDGSIYLASIYGGNVRISEADPAAPTAFNPLRETGVPASRVQLAAGPEGLWVARISGPTVDLRLTDSLGQEWKEVITLSGATDATVCRVADGRLLVLTIESGTVKGRLFDPLGALVEGPWDTNVSGLASGARIDSAAFPKGGSSFGIDLAVSGIATPYVATSDDGGLTFS